LIHCSLISLGKYGDVAGNLAESWTWENPSTVTFILKDGAKFSDGTPVTPGDVKSTYESILNATASSSFASTGYENRIKAIRTSARAVTFELIGPDTAILAELNLGILPSSMAHATNLVPDPQIHGCGPFKIESRSEASLLLIKNPFYKLENTSMPPGIDFKFSSSQRDALANLESGKVDILFGTDRPENFVGFAKEHPGMRIEKQPGFSTNYLGFNLSDVRLADIRVRKAIAVAIDRDAIIKHSLQGFAVSARSMLIPRHPYFNDRLPDIHLDRDAANQLLDEAGFKSRDLAGIRFSLSLKTVLEPVSIEVAKAIAADLAKIGISVQVQALELSKLRGEATAGNIQLWTMTKGGLRDPDVYRTQFSASGSADSIGQWARYNSVEIERLLKLGVGESVMANRKQVYDRVQDLISSDLPAVFLWHDDRVALIQKKVKGFDLHADGSLSSLFGVSIDP
jgi:peptide/nickel transport system substrate-binding protein